jgi:phage terminase small subunit
MALTDKQELFAKEYIVDLNAGAAAIRAGYSEKTAYEMGYENLRKPHLAEYIQTLMKERSDKTAINAQWVLDRLTELTNRCMQAEMVTDREGNPTGEWKFDSSGANKALDSIGRHLGMFNDKLRVDGNMNTTTQDITNLPQEERRARIDELNRRRGNGTSSTA